MKHSYSCKCSAAKSEKDEVLHQPHGSPQELLSSFVVSCFCHAQTTLTFPPHPGKKESHGLLLLAGRDVKKRRFLFFLWVFLFEPGSFKSWSHSQKAGLALRLVVPAKQSLQTSLPLAFHQRRSFVIPKMILGGKRKKNCH